MIAFSRMSLCPKIHVWIFSRDMLVVISKEFLLLMCIKIEKPNIFFGHFDSFFLILREDFLILNPPTKNVPTF